MTLRGMREAAGLTQEALAAKANIPQSTVSALEVGRILNPGMETLEALALAHGVSVSAIIAAVRETAAEI